MLDIIGIDSSVVDHIISIDCLPGWDEEIAMYGQNLSSRFQEADILMAEYAKEKGAVIGFDGDEYREDIEKHIGIFDIFIGSEFFYRDWFQGQGTREENCRKVWEKGSQIVIFTFGKQGMQALYPR